MPTYEYQCPNGHLFEEFQSITHAPLSVCPECGAEAVRKISAGSGLIFKGSGFYITDYKGSKNASTESKSDAKKNSDSSPSETKPAESKPAETKSTETKPAAETKSKPKDNPS